MTDNLLALLKDQVTGSLAKEAASFLGEDQGAVTGALGSIFPSLLGGLIEKSSDQSALGKIFDLVQGTDSGLLGNIGDLFGGGASSVNGLLNSGGGIADMIFGDKIGGVIDLISKVSGLKSGSTGSLLKLAAPFLMSMIGKKVAGGGVSGLLDLLMGQKEHVKAAMPKGLGDIMGLSSLGDLGKAAFSAAGDAGKAVSNAGKTAATTATAAAEGGMGWLKWLLPILLLGALAYYFGGKGCAKDAADAATSAVESTVDAAKDAADATVGAVAGAADWAKGAFENVNADAKAALDKLTFTAGSIGEQMTSYINGGFSGENKFRFTNLTFDTGSANISGQTGVEVDNLAAILNAYPGVKVAVHGHTDNTGDEAANMELSKARAEAVKARLVAQGIAGDRISTEGHGSAMPAASNDTEEGRAQNRRIEVVLVQ